MNPPIPPNCPYFGNDREPFSFNFMEHFHPWTPEFSPFQKRIIASVARCAWLDEEQHILNSDGWKMDDEIREKSVLIEAAKTNAEAWRIWGESK